MNSIKKQHEDFIGEITEFLESLIFKPILIRPGSSEYSVTKGVLLKYIQVPYKDELEEVPHISFHLFLHSYKELSDLEGSDYSGLEKTLSVHYEPYHYAVGLDVPEKDKEEIIPDDSEDQSQKTDGDSCTKCTLDFVCVIKTKIYELFTNIPVRLYPKKIVVWDNILREIGTDCPHFNPIINLE